MKKDKLDTEIDKILYKLCFDAQKRVIKTLLKPEYKQIYNANTILLLNKFKERLDEDKGM